MTPVQPYPPNEATRRQLVEIILLDAMQQAATKGWTEAEFKANLRERLSPTAQRELAV